MTSLLLLILGALGFSSMSEAATGYDAAIKSLTIPDGYKISLYAQVPGARSIAQASDGTLFVGTGGFANPFKRVYRIKDWNKNSKIDSDEVEVFIDALNNPNGVAFRKGSLYVAEINRILVFKDVLTVAKGKTLKGKDATILPQRFPNDMHHGWKFVRFAPPPEDKWLYVAVGAPCNVCETELPFAAIHRINVEGTETELVASGVRNTLGFDFHPTTKNLWFTDNGRDNMGDNIPGDELNEVTAKGQNFGFPHCHANNLVDPEFNVENKIKCAQTVPPKVVLGPHSATLGMRFFNGDAIVAEHGSWNSSKKLGYKVSIIRKNGNSYKYDNFVKGWLNEKKQVAWGRPVDVEVLSNNALLISDDGMPQTEFKGALYKLERK